MEGSWLADHWPYALAFLVGAGGALVALLKGKEVLEKFAAEEVVEAEKTEARLEVDRLEGQLQSYYLLSEPHGYPESLREMTTGEDPVAKKIPHDPWGNRYVYEKPKTTDGDPTVCSKGPDGGIDTKDDICSQDGPS